MDMIETKALEFAYPAEEGAEAGPGPAGRGHGH